MKWIITSVEHKLVVPSRIQMLIEVQLSHIIIIIFMMSVFNVSSVTTSVNRLDLLVKILDLNQIT